MRATSAPESWPPSPDGEPAEYLQDSEETREFCGRIATRLFEVLVGTRAPEQLVRWLSENAFRELLSRAMLADRARQFAGGSAPRQTCAVTLIRMQFPSSDAVEATVLLQVAGKTRSVPIRLDRLGGRWSASAIHLL